MLVGLGLVALVGPKRAPHAHAHDHGHAHAHAHAHEHEHEHAHPHARGANRMRPIAVGIVHGASGTAALTLLVATTIPGRVDALAFILLFGLASVLGMSIAAALFAVPLRGVARRAPGFAPFVRGLAGVASIAAGCFVGWAALTTSALS
jgi:ABC-type nickel/cobalt efflux system permease component RcnA